MDFGPSPSTEESSTRSTGMSFLSLSYSFIFPDRINSSIFSPIERPTPGIFSTSFKPPFLYISETGSAKELIASDAFS